MKMSLLLWTKEEEQRVKEMKLKNGLLCPVCEQPPVLTCNCILRDSACAQKHTWHVQDGVVREGWGHTPPSGTTSNEWVCPVCQQPPIRRCRCPMSDSECGNGHSWYWKDGKVQRGWVSHF